MENEIRQVLSGLPDVRVKRVATLWQIGVGGLAGAREDGLSLARDLKAQYEQRKAREATVPRPVHAYTAEPEPVEIPAFLKPDPRDAKIAELEAALAAAAAPKPEPVKPEGAFDASQLSDLIRENEPHADAQRRWLSDFTQLTNRLVDIRLPALNDAERAYQRRLQAALYSSRRGAVETI